MTNLIPFSTLRISLEVIFYSTVALWTLKVMEVVPDDHMLLFFCIDYTIWPGAVKLFTDKLFFCFWRSSSKIILSNFFLQVGTIGESTFCRERKCWKPKFVGNWVRPHIEEWEWITIGEYKNSKMGEYKKRILRTKRIFEFQKH